MVKAVGKEIGRRIETTCLCYPNYGLEDHWNDGKLQKLMKKEDFDFVVFQQGPSSQAYGRSSLHEFGRKISTLVREHGAQPAYFMVWPSMQYYLTFEGVIKNHRDAAEANQALLIPLGEHWRKLHESKFAPTLYGPDGFHPAKEGSFLAALTICKSLFPEANLEQVRFSKVKRWVDKKTFTVINQLLK